MKVDELRVMQGIYASSCGGVTCVREADETWNGLNMDILRAFSKEHEQGCMGLFNGTAVAPRRISDVGRLENFCCDYVIPERNEALEALISKWKSSRKAEDLEAAFEEIRRCDGFPVVWV